ncbi:zona pellucida sperm-binding protein 3-like isoform X1 [Arapaima gigas]
MSIVRCVSLLVFCGVCTSSITNTFLNISSITNMSTRVPRDATPSFSVSCSGGALTLRVTAPPSGNLTLGRRCRSNGVDRATGELLFTYSLISCGGTRQVRRRFILYRFVLRYGGSEAGARRGRAHIECRLKRVHHVYKLAVRPTWDTPPHALLRGPTVGYRIQVMDASWTAPQPHRVHLLQQQVNVQVSVLHLPPRGRLYVDHCYATSSAEPKSRPRHTLIQNFGCMVDHSGVFTHRTRRTVDYAFDAFQFAQDPTTQVFLHCRLFVSAEGPGPTAKSCSYNPVEKRWKSLTGPHSVCDCCDSLCVPTKTRRSMSEGFLSSGPLAFVHDLPTGVSGDDGHNVIFFEGMADGSGDEQKDGQEERQEFCVQGWRSQVSERP